MKESFGKKEKLKSDILISRVFAEGCSFTRYPLKLVYLPLEGGENKFHKAGVTVAKRNFKKAVDRVHLKRLMRESFRKNKYLVDGQEVKYALMFIYIGKQKEDYQKVFEAMAELLKKVAARE